MFPSCTTSGDFHLKWFDKLTTERKLLLFLSNERPSRCLTRERSFFYSSIRPAPFAKGAGLLGVTVIAYDQSNAFEDIPLGKLGVGSPLLIILSKTYDPSVSEDSIYKMWEESGAFKADAKSKKEAFTISMPPPNATGNLHLGHAVMLALEDIFIRFQRMRGKEVLWVPGTDHAAIATESMVIRKLQK